MATVEDEIARLAAADGYQVTAQNDRLVELERKNSWLSVFLTGLMAGGHMGLQRRERVYLWVDDEGNAKLMLHRRPDVASP